MKQFKSKVFTQDQIEKVSPKWKDAWKELKDDFSDNWDVDALEEQDIVELDELVFKHIKEELEAIDNAPKPVVEKKTEIPKNKTATKPSAAPKKAAVSPTAAKKQTPKKAAPKKKATVAFSHLRKTPADILAKGHPVKFGCEFTAVIAETDQEIEVKHKVKKGEYILHLADGTVHSAMTKYGYDKRCEASQPKPKSVAAKKKEEPAKPIEPTSPKSTVEPKKTNAPKKSCDLKSFPNKMPSPLRVWLEGMMEGWKKKKEHRKVTKIMYIKETNKIIVEISFYDPMLRRVGLTTRAIHNPNYFFICLKSSRLTKTDKPKNGTYRLLGKEELKQLYSTKKNWNKCSKIIKEAYSACKDGDCTQADREKYKTYYYECGDMVEKAETRKLLSFYHEETRKRYNPKEDNYYDVFKETVKTLKEKSVEMAF